jgi:DNA-binding XRE family transcriptional regulator
MSYGDGQKLLHYSQKRYRLGEHLRKLRLSQSLRQGDVASRLGVVPTTISRLESGLAPVKLAYLSVMLDIYGVTDPAERDRLTTLALDGTRNGDWWSPTAMPRSAWRHAVKPGCPVICIEDRMPSRAFTAVKAHLRGHAKIAHPIVSDVVWLFESGNPAEIPGLTARGAVLITEVLQSCSTRAPRRSVTSAVRTRPLSWPPSPASTCRRPGSCRSRCTCGCWG